MNVPLAEIIRRIHDAPLRIVLVVTGGGSGAIGELLKVPGASRTLLEAVVPYTSRAVDRLLGGPPEHYCSADTGRAFAAAAYHRALDLREGDEAVAGVGCTASLASDRPKRGDHRCHVAAQDRSSTTTYSLTLAKGARDRAGEEDVVARLILHAIARACGLADDVSLTLLENERVETVRTEAPPAVEQLVAGKVARVFVARDGTMQAPGPEIQAALPGAFDPLHEGHSDLARVAGEQLGCEVAFELSVTNVDKPPLDFTEIDRRVRQFAGQHTLVLTDAPTFLEKARLIPGCVFVVGVDTAERIVAPRYYGSSEQRMVAALEEIRALGCRFLVAGRKVRDCWRTLSDVGVPARFGDLFEAIPEERFRRDISSTEIRACTAEDGETR
jgi:hypothetical protein